MTPRRSTRLKNPPNQKSSDAARDVPVRTENGTKRKSPTGQEVTGNAGSAKSAKRAATEVKVRATASKAEEPNVQHSDKLSSLSPEIFDMIANNITDKSAISALMRTSKGLYTLMAPQLYNRIAVASMFHAHIAKLIRTLEPHLTIQQKKQLKKEGKYKGQQERYPTGLDEKSVPVCASYVRQLIIGVSDPGKNHKYIVDRYYEEALKNMKNLEILETRVVNKAVCEGIASLASLKALGIYAFNAQANDVTPLNRLRDLKHLKLEFGSDALFTGQSLLRNSMSTLQSLEIASDGYGHYFRNWTKNLQSHGRDTARSADVEPKFSALKVLRIQGMTIDEEFIQGFSDAIDFSKLRELTFAHPRDSQTLLWPSLTKLATSCKRSNTPLALRSLSIDMHDSEYQYDLEQQRALFATKCAFIASFDTLTTLKLPGYGQYRSNQALRNPALSDTLLQAILNHKKLRVLRISYNGVTSGLEIPYLGPQPVEDIINGLPQLREFEFAPDEAQMDEISQALCRGRNLETLICFPHASWNAYPRPDQLGANILTSVLSTFMSNAKIDADGKEFIWEDHYELNRLDLSYICWDIASKFDKPKKVKGYQKPEKVQAKADGGLREVWHQLVPRKIYIHVGYDPFFKWVTKAEREIE